MVVTVSNTITQYQKRSVTTTTAISVVLVTACTSSPGAPAVARISSACSCFLSASATATVSTSALTTLSAYVRLLLRFLMYLHLRTSKLTHFTRRSPSQPPISQPQRSLSRAPRPQSLLLSFSQELAPISLHTMSLFQTLLSILVADNTISHPCL